MTDATGPGPETDTAVVDAPSRELVATNPATGEAIELDSSSDLTLAQAILELKTIRARMGDFEAAVGEELIRRLDRGGEWTMRLPHPRQDDVRIKVTAPSPSAGSTYTDPDALEVELRALVDAQTITPAAAAKALKRTVTVTFELPLHDDLAAFKETARKDERVIDIKDDQKAQQSGINSLGKISDEVATALRRAKRRNSPPARRATVSLETPKRGRS